MVTTWCIRLGLICCVALSSVAHAQQQPELTETQKAMINRYHAYGTALAQCDYEFARQREFTQQAQARVKELEGKLDELAPEWKGETQE